MKILIYGFGRMGLTHFSILNGINPEIQFSVIEPNKLLRKILKKNINAKFNSNDLNISFNSRYLTDIASQIENEFIVINLKDANSPVLINDFSDKNSFYVVMPMKI